MNISTDPKKLRGFEKSIRTSGVENLSRRKVLKGLGLAGSFVLAAPVMSRPAFAAYETGAGKMPHGTVVDPKVFVAIAPDGIVTIVAHRSEMGTGVRTSLPLVVAEEMDADWARVRVQQAPGDEVKYGNQDTDGSRSTRHYLIPMRQIGASARTMLEQAAAKRWGVPASELKAVNHEIVHEASGRKIGFGELAADAAKEPVPALDSLKLKDPSTFRYLGKGTVSIVDLRDITMGKAHYGSDTRLPGMKYAVIARPPVTGGKLKSFDSTEAMKVSGVEKVMEVKGWPWPSKFQPLGGVAVIARNTGAAIKGRDALKLVWDDGANGKYDSVAYRAELEQAARKPGLVVRKEGDVDAALKSADKVIVGEYYQPHLAHVSMEPPVAVADVKGDKAEIWAPVQSPGGTREDVAKTLGIPEDNVTVNVTLLGGGFGRKSKCDFALEAALLSKELGAPVKVQWTREDDVRHDFLHTVSLERIEAGLDKSGKVIAWRHRSVAPTIASTFEAGATHQAAFELGMGLVDMPFQIANIQCENPEIAAYTRIGWFRSVSNIPRAFAIGSMVGELAQATGRDQKTMLLELIGVAADHRHVRGEGFLGLWRALCQLSDRHRATAQGRRAGRRQGRMGPIRPEGTRPRHRRASELCELHRYHRRGRRRREGQAHRAAGRYRDRLRHLYQPRAHPVADRGRRDHGSEPRQIWRDHLQGRQGAAGQFRQLPGGPDRRGAAPDERSYRAARTRYAAERGRRTRRSAVRTGIGERDLRGHRQAHPHPSDRQAARDVSVAAKAVQKQMRRRCSAAFSSDAAPACAARAIIS